jgi:GIY-YIG catalytic domain
MPRTMVDYSKSCVYRIAWKDITYYVGSTTNFANRKCQHKSAAKDVKNEFKLYKFIRNNGGWTDEWCMVLVNEYPDFKTANELHQYERDAYDFYKPELNVNKPALRESEKSDVGEKDKETVHQCIPCGCLCCSRSNLVKHFSSKKHINKIQNPDAVIVGEFKCPNCVKTYKGNTGLWAHKKKCNAPDPIIPTAQEIVTEVDLHAKIDKLEKENNNLKELIIELVKNMQPK